MIDELINELINESLRKREIRLEYALRHLISRPIKGEITRRKIKLRGLKLCICPTDKTEERPDGSAIFLIGEKAYIEEPDGRVIDLY